MPREIQDILKYVRTALPAQNTTAQSASIDLEQTPADSVNEVIDVIIRLPATPNLANGQTITFSIQDSADNSSFATVAGTGSFVVTGAGGNGGPAFPVAAIPNSPGMPHFKLPPQTRRYIRAQVVTSATAGDNTAVFYTFQLGF